MCFATLASQVGWYINYKFLLRLLSTIILCNCDKCTLSVEPPGTIVSVVISRIPILSKVQSQAAFSTLKTLSYPDKSLIFFTLLVIDVDYIGPFLKGLAKNRFCWYVNLSKFEKLPILIPRIPSGVPITSTSRNFCAGLGRPGPVLEYFVKMHALAV